MLRERLEYLECSEAGLWILPLAVAVGWKSVELLVALHILSGCGCGCVPGHPCTTAPGHPCIAVPGHLCKISWGSAGLGSKPRVGDGWAMTHLNRKGLRDIRSLFGALGCHSAKTCASIGWGSGF